MPYIALVLCIATSPDVENLNCYRTLHLAASPNSITAYITEAPYILQINPTVCIFDSPTGEVLCLTYKEP